MADNLYTAFAFSLRFSPFLDFRALLNTVTNKMGIDYAHALGSWQSNMREGAEHMRQLLIMLEALETSDDAAANDPDDPLAHLRNPNGTITIKSHGYPTGDDITRIIQDYRDLVS